MAKIEVSAPSQNPIADQIRATAAAIRPLAAVLKDFGERQAEALQAHAAWLMEQWGSRELDACPFRTIDEQRQAYELPGSSTKARLTVSAPRGEQLRAEGGRVLSVPLGWYRSRIGALDSEGAKSEASAQDTKRLRPLLESQAGRLRLQEAIHQGLVKLNKNKKADWELVGMVLVPDDANPNAMSMYPLVYSEAIAKAIPVLQEALNRDR